jgi:cation:H+ antiporter
VGIVLLATGFAAVLGGALLFTNAVEWAGTRLGLGVGAVGTILAAVSTALPESVIPVVAVLRGDSDADDVAVGAILGAPFMLATVAMALLGLAALGFSRRRAQGSRLRLQRGIARRDLVFFLVLMSATLVLGLGTPDLLRYAAAPLLVLAYGGYVVLTVRRAGAAQPDEELPALIADPTKRDPPANAAIALQFIVGLGLIVGGAHVIVGELIAIAERIGVSPLVLALLVAPLATELPEKANSVLWIREGKDALAVGNVTGAMVFQSTLPVAIGLAFTSWELDRFALLAGVLALAGGAVALYALDVRARLSVQAIATFVALAVAFVAAVWLAG